MEKSIYINVSLDEMRLAILEDQSLVELYYELPQNERMVGDIYFARVAKVIKGLQAAFIDIGQKQDAFLHFSDLDDRLLGFDPSSKEGNVFPRHRSYSWTADDVPIKRGDRILVQITKEPLAAKGARVTSNISLPGRYLVLVPNDNVVGVSRKIYNRKEKYRLKRVGQKFRREGFGMVIRTVAEGKEEADLKADYENLIKTWEQLVKKMKGSQPPQLVHKEVGMLSSVIRDLFTADVSQLIVDDKKLFREIVRYMRDVSPQLTERVKLHQEKVPIFDKYNIESQINKSLSRKVWLKRGGYIFIDHTEALTAIDVNSGRFSGKADHDMNSLKINLDAAKEIARQLRLRDIGGIIIIDFIDMINPKNRQKLQEEFKKELRKDRAQANIAPVSEFGIIEMTRERVRPALLFAISEPCPACVGTGRVISKSTTSAKIERWMKRYRREGGSRSVQLVVHPELAKYLSAGKKSPLRKLTWSYWTRIKIVQDENISMDEFRFMDKMGEEDLTDRFIS
ncbi:Rne/Rng family ribonuclease [candidate division KSB1 bacterium]|nr:Rne/Rng family ribonuclease [candidate division KSB1 bacterium]RQW07475.1 MAG: Rne/Rng family ribonuclease [candidate division KSB1 bacterium]